MRTSLTSGAMVEAAVTVAVAILMTVAGFEMLIDNGTNDAPAAIRAVSVTEVISMPQIGESFGAVGATGIRLPHVDVAQV